MRGMNWTAAVEFAQIAAVILKPSSRADFAWANILQQAPHVPRRRL